MRCVYMRREMGLTIPTELPWGAGETPTSPSRSAQRAQPSQEAVVLHPLWASRLPEFMCRSAKAFLRNTYSIQKHARCV